jgi:hypothetical protein
MNRFAVAQNADEAGGIDMDPIASDREPVETLEYLCMAAIGICVAVNQIIGGAPRRTGRSTASPNVTRRSRTGPRPNSKPLHEP